MFAVTASILLPSGHESDEAIKSIGAGKRNRIAAAWHSIEAVGQRESVLYNPSIDSGR
jgi:hypothetical protein